MTPLDKLLARLRELEQKAMPAVWSCHDQMVGTLYREMEIRNIHGGAMFRSTSYGLMSEDAQLIVESRNALPVLLDIVARQNEALDFYSWLDNTDIDGPDMSSIAKKAIAECDALAEKLNASSLTKPLPETNSSD